MLVEFSVLPLGAGEHLHAAVAAAIRLIDESGLDYRVHAMGTEIEGAWDEVMSLIRRCHEEVARQSPRVYTVIKIDDFKDQAGMITSKVESVEKTLGRKIKS